MKKYNLVLSEGFFLASPVEKVTTGKIILPADAGSTKDIILKVEAVAENSNVQVGDYCIVSQIHGTKIPKSITMTEDGNIGADILDDERLLLARTANITVRYVDSEKA